MNTPFGGDQSSVLTTMSRLLLPLMEMAESTKPSLPLECVKTCGSVVLNTFTLTASITA